MCVCVCVCVCVLGAGVGTGRDGIKGSNIMIHFLYILLDAAFHMAHVLAYYALFVVIIICIIYIENVRDCCKAQ